MFRNSKIVIIFLCLFCIFLGNFRLEGQNAGRSLSHEVFAEIWNRFAQMSLNGNKSGFKENFLPLSSSMQRDLFMYKEKDSKTLLHLAVESGKPEMVEFLLDYKGNKTSYYDKRTSPLSIAITKSNIEIIKLLIRKGFDPIVDVEKTYSPLRQALDLNNDIICRFLISEFARSSKQSDKYFDVFNYLVERGKIDYARDLLKAVDWKAVERVTPEKHPLVRAVLASDTEIVRNVLDTGFNVNVAAHPQNWSVFRVGTALHYAAKMGDQKMIDLLLSKGADPKIANDAKEYPYDWAIKNRHWNVADILFKSAGQNPLSIYSLKMVINNLAVETAEYLLERGADPMEGYSYKYGTDSKKTRNLLHILAEAPERKGSSAILTAKLLIKHGLKEVINELDYEKETPLFIAVKNPSHGRNFINYLINNGADPKIICHGKSLFHAILSGCDKVGEGLRKDFEEIVDLLLYCGVDINSLDDRGDTILHTALAEGKNISLEIIKVLLDRGADPNIADSSGRPILDCINGYYRGDRRNRLIEILQSYGATSRLKVLGQD